MDNGLNMLTVYTLGKVKRGEFFDSQMYVNDSIQSFENVIIASRESRRPKPSRFLPSNGTRSVFSVDRHTTLKTGKIGKELDWRPYSPTYYREVYGSNIENQNDIINRSALIGLEDQLPVIRNKIRQEIISSKGQLAVDLIELGKTKALLESSAIGLLQAYRDLRAGRSFRRFVRDMRKEGFNSYLGRKWLEYIYGWAPTVSGAFETAEILSKRFQTGSIVTGKVGNTARIRIQRRMDYGTEDVFCVSRAKGYYQYTIKDPKLLQLTQLGFTNPLSIAWELLPWSFVLDWFVDVGGYINRMDFALGISDIWYQYAVQRRCQVYLDYERAPYIGYLNPEDHCIAVANNKTSFRSTPSSDLPNSFMGVKKFTNETVRLTSAVALLNQQVSRIKRVR